MTKPFFVLAMSVCIVAGTGCLKQTRIERVLPTPQATATLDELIGKLKTFGNIHTMKSTVEMRLSVAMDQKKTRAKPGKGKNKIREVQEFTEVSGFVLIERPNKIRTVAEVPLVRSTAFDMVSDGIEFKVHIPPKNKFLLGHTMVHGSPQERIDRVRPQHLLEAILLDPPRDDEPYRMVENFLFGKRSYQIIHLMSSEQDGILTLSRKIWFDRAGFYVVRVQGFDNLGNLVADISYTGWSETKGLPYPETVFLSRPQDGYEVQIRIVDPGLNESLSERSFELIPPKGIKIERIGKSRETPVEETEQRD